jgi:hypothetical protein
MSDRLHSPYKYLFWGLIFIFGGILWRLTQQDWFEISWTLLLPALLIIFGLALLISGFLRPRSSRARDANDGSPKEGRS